MALPNVPVMMSTRPMTPQNSAGHTKEDLDFAVRCFGEVKREMGL